MADYGIGFKWFVTCCIIGAVGFIILCRILSKPPDSM